MIKPRPPSPSIAFSPVLSLQRQAFILETLRTIKPKSVLDVGCGEGRLLECLARCDEALPVELLVGVDISISALQQASHSIEYSAETQQNEGRWRALDVTLLHGRFTELERETGTFQAVVSSEVIEHLDPPDLERYWDVHLGILQPDMLIVTTPNREFNVIFETVERLSEIPPQSYEREDLGYTVRNEDHRFEYTRAEFSEQRCKAAQTFGYDVSITGVGTPQNAINGSPDFFDDYPQLLEVGYCTQIGIFSRTRPRVSQSTSSHWGNLQVVTHLHYPCNIFTPYPPDPDTIATSIGAMWRQFRPEYITDPSDTTFEPSPIAKICGGVYFESEDGLVLQVSVEKLWDLDYSLRKLCRFNRNVFTKETQKLDGVVYDRGIGPISPDTELQEFVGIEVSRGSLKRFRFVCVHDITHILYEFSKDYMEMVYSDLEGLD